MQMEKYMSGAKTTIMSLALIVSSLVVGTSCSDSDDLGTTDYSWNISGNKVVNIKPSVISSSVTHYRVGISIRVLAVE